MNTSGKHTKRLRIFAGPNGSGKSSLFDYLVNINAFNKYYHINPDDIAKDIPVGIDLEQWPIDVNYEELVRYLDASPFQNRSKQCLSDRLHVAGKVISLKNDNAPDNTYLCAGLGEFIRAKMLAADSSFSFETVFSHPSKTEQIIRAKKAGFKIYLYIIATSNPHINVTRVQNRVCGGGHDVPEKKVEDRYYKTMQNMYDAFCAAERVYFFDNSESGRNTGGLYQFFAEKRDNKLLLANGAVPQWFHQYILENLGS
jgi:predicted ABC-type ATPase